MGHRFVSTSTQTITPYRGRSTSEGFASRRPEPPRPLHPQSTMPMRRGRVRPGGGSRRPRRTSLSDLPRVAPVQGSRVEVLRPSWRRQPAASVGVDTAVHRLHGRLRRNSLSSTFEASARRALSGCAEAMRATAPIRSPYPPARAGPATSSSFMGSPSSGSRQSTKGVWLSRVAFDSSCDRSARLTVFTVRHE
jgi:hypothetical protein